MSNKDQEVSSSSNDTVIQAMQQQFERMFKVIGDVRDHLKRHVEAITRLQGEPRRGRQPAFVNDVYDGGEDTDNGQATIIGQDVNPRRQIRRGEDLHRTPETSSSAAIIDNNGVFEGSYLVTPPKNVIGKKKGSTDQDDRVGKLPMCS
ncbi:hypothetical protein LWI29_012382 [Acer saccharum]|uniref:Uncharacterized protein n=1 Tax=Acer saccharum TaxID=4024 RepID=A0AA39RX20_ACESA|nr:hypothetical protein LWI29_012382 [Acer saccharum]